ncbi:MAG: hypothetical protein QNJ40_08000 [Xanthomonadales bacterium]|nr:hypothetical protein [Xanthomonadales bacterium]
MNSKIRLPLLLGISVFVVAASAADKQLVVHMHEHYGLVTAIQKAVIAGNLEATKAPARQLVERPAPPGLEGNWQPFDDAMRAAAQKALDATSLEKAAEATAELGNSCANCHVEYGVEDQFEKQAKPSFDDGAAAHMQRHMWAADRMWEGLIAPSRKIWKKGANQLVETALKPHEIHPNANRNVARMERLVHGIAASATRKKDGEGRVYSYGQLLATCAACHQELGMSPSTD